ncbi:hypothetical protein CPB84DRAFT_1752107 [Gymnopilus junonius]|uniref:chitin deacetylase n=1 Tax=Gymnopilus junonius TaxID=109634 RepID=A0A9P5THA3_GYMJU|nr:hypothetical protein CPB84DRAFT_1752107 [Gymnopilus junonius]
MRTTTPMQSNRPSLATPGITNLVTPCTSSSDAMAVPPFSLHNSLPASWVSALNGAVAAGLIPNIPQSTGMPNQSPTYPAGFDPTSPNCVAPGDVASAPDGVFASSFDDGPTQFSPTLLEFLESQGKTTTHFMIGVNILQNPTQFESIFNAGHDIAVHTYTHPYMTTLSNLDLVAQFGWTMQIIYDSTGGRVPKYWRPPYGDTDMRVRAIAKEIFGLTTVVWNHDSADWAQTATPPIETALTGFLASPKHPGLIILEHELTNITVSGFIEAYPLIQQNGWNCQSLIKASGNGATYQNAQGDTGAYDEFKFELEFEFNQFEHEHERQYEYQFVLLDFFILLYELISFRLVDVSVRHDDIYQPVNYADDPDERRTVLVHSKPTHTRRAVFEHRHLLHHARCIAVFMTLGLIFAFILILILIRLHPHLHLHPHTSLLLTSSNLPHERVELEL